MANSLTNLVPDFYRALDVVSREMVGFIPAVTLDAGSARAAMGQNIRVAVTTPGTPENTTAGSIPPDTGDQTVNNVPFTITRSKTVPFRWTGEDQMGVNNGGPGYLNIRQGQIAQALRQLVNMIEVDLGSLYTRTSRAYGTAGTTAFGTNGIADLAQFRKILADNGAPMNDLQLVFDTTAGANMRSLSNLFKVSESGDTNLLRQGILGDLFDFSIRESAGVNFVTKGTGSAYVTSGSTAVGVDSIALVTGSGTVNAGDVVTFAADATNKYVVGTGVAAPGTIALNDPGAQIIIPTANALTVGNSYKANMGFHRSAIILATRPPALPEEGDMAADRMLITDPRSGMTFELAMYLQYRRVRYEVSLAWGYQNIKPQHTAILLG